MEITYTRKGDYLYPNFTLDPMDTVEIGKYGRMRRRYLREHREALYWGMYVEGTLTQHLLEVDETAQAQVDLTVRRLLKQHPAPGQGRGLPRLCWAFEQSDHHGRGKSASRSDLRLIGVLLQSRHFSSQVKFERRRSDAQI